MRIVATKLVTPFPSSPSPNTVRAETITCLILQKASLVIFITCLLELMVFKPTPMIFAASRAKPENSLFLERNCRSRKSEPLEPSHARTVTEPIQSKWHRRSLPLPSRSRVQLHPRRGSFLSFECVAGVSQLHPPKGPCRTPSRTPCTVSQVVWTSETLSRSRRWSSYTCECRATI